MSDKKAAASEQHTYLCTHLHIYTQTCMHAHTHTCIHKYRHVNTQTHARTPAHAHADTDVCACTRVCMRVLCAIVCIDVGGIQVCSFIANTHNIQCECSRTHSHIRQRTSTQWKQLRVKVRVYQCWESPASCNAEPVFLVRSFSHSIPAPPRSRATTV